MKARGQLGEVADIVEQDPLVIAGDKYATLRKFAPLMIEVLEFRSGRGSAASVKAIDLLRDLNASGKREVPTDAPSRSARNGAGWWSAQTAGLAADSTRPLRWPIPPQ